MSFVVQVFHAMDISNYSIAAHLIHSRMQLIRHRLEISEHIEIANLVYRNREFFDKAAASVLKHHNVASEYKDLANAAELLYKSIYPPPGANDLRYYTVQYFDSRTQMWLDIKWWDEEKGFVLADPAERMNVREAMHRLASMKVGVALCFKVVTKYTSRKIS
jgi:hypothetical protein